MPSTPARFTNEVSPEYLRSLDHHDPEHPTLAIFRLATEGSRSRNGGVIRKASSPVQIVLPNGDKVRVACAGDLVEYANGSSAAILHGSCNRGRPGSGTPRRQDHHRCDLYRKFPLVDPGWSGRPAYRRQYDPMSQMWRGGHHRGRLTCHSLARPRDSTAWRAHSMRLPDR